MSDSLKNPSVKEKAFNCPHCNAYAAQDWYNLCVDPCGYRGELPQTYGVENYDYLTATPEDCDYTIDDVREFISGKISVISMHRTLGTKKIKNAFASQCHNCDGVAVWVTDNLVYPVAKSVVSPNKDMPEDIKIDFEEARSIFEFSPRASAALLRLCIQKLCIHLGGSTGKIDSDIAEMVKNGLSPLVQQSLDIVRVIGNESVHPGSIDLNDERETAAQLFNIVNVIVMQMISQPKIINEMYANLPESKLRGIENRDKVKASK
ncbi:DUF4145 domain-containing protein [Aeromonas hydrophila]|uniref:DUF4145 domain-containing protein n=1 Tax=Aeromonas hydrophila TaxID=644 RepID=UPI003D20EE56